MSVLVGIKPERVFYYFEQICSIPHGSGNTGAISDWAVATAKSLGLWCKKDELNDVIIKKPASAGYENHPAVILQGHLDMVCEKEIDCPIDFLKDGLSLACEGDYIYANGTTLGGDDGIAVAMAFAVLEDKTIVHPPIEVVFTVDEETGMYGAHAIDLSCLSGKYLINIDSEAEGYITVGCAGGARADIAIKLNMTDNAKPCYKITVDGLIGGHSGSEINKGRQNANILMGRLLSELENVRLAEISGGLKDNAIPRASVCIISADGDVVSAAKQFESENRISSDSGFKISVTSIPAVAKIADTESSSKVIKLLSTVVNGVQSMSRDIEGLVETSLNLGVLATDNDTVRANFSVRSSVNSEKEKLLGVLEKTAKKADGKISFHAPYPAWEYKKNSVLRDTMVRIYEKMFGRKPVVETIHAGLECGLLSEKIPGLDAVSIGPDILDIHTTREKLSISSTARLYDYLCNILKAL